jgi:hypothetical protein
MTEKRYLIVGLRVNHPTILGAALPGYLSAATEHHRYGFHILGQWYAWSSDPATALGFKSETECDSIICEIIAIDNGWYQPLSVLPVITKLGWYE